MAERKLIHQISATLPQTEEIAGAIAIIEEFVKVKSGV